MNFEAPSAGQQSAYSKKETAFIPDTKTIAGVSFSESSPTAWKRILDNAVESLLQKSTISAEVVSGLTKILSENPSAAKELQMCTLTWETTLANISAPGDGGTLDAEVERIETKMAEKLAGIIQSILDNDKNVLTKMGSDNRLAS
jgi:hypothetical protein